MSGKDELLNIKVGGKDYEIIYTHPVTVGNNLTWGSCDYANCEIHIDSEICEQMQFNSLIHELLHACLYEIGSDLHADEQFVESLGNMLAQVIKDNRDSFE